jgi:hypothetical protein
LTGVLPWLVPWWVPRLVPWARCVGTRDFFPFLPALVGPVQIYFRATFSLDLSTSPQQAGQAVVPRHLSLNNYILLELSLPQALHAS